MLTLQECIIPVGCLLVYAALVSDLAELHFHIRVTKGLKLIYI